MAISCLLYTSLGFNTSLLVDSVSNVGNKSVQYEGDDLKISQAEVVINGTDTPAETVKPTATADPTATAVSYTHLDVYKRQQYQLYKNRKDNYRKTII